MARDYKAILFDLDGTLLDSIPGILASFNDTLSHFKPDSLISRTDLVNMIGRPLELQMASLGGPAAAAHMVAHYRRHNVEIIPSMPLYEGALEAVRSLKDRGLKVGIVTAKAESSARISFEQYGFHTLMDVLVTANDTEVHKPEPDPLLLALNRLGVEPTDALYVGDAIFDIQCAQAAGSDSAAALWGPNPEAKLAAENPTYLLSHLNTLVKTVLP